MNLSLIKEELLKHELKYIQTIGGGSYSTVFLCKSFKYNDFFAVKCIYKEKMKEYEYNALIHLNHPHIILLYEVINEPDRQYLVMEYCSNYTLKSRGKLNYDDFIKYSKQVLQALSFCHSKMIAHRDIKPDNILLDKYDRVKLADFGFAKQFDSNAPTSNERVGSLMYMAPEIINGHKMFNPFKADVYALGITFFYMATEKMPFTAASKDDLIRFINFGNIDFTQYDDVDPEIQKMIMKMTSHNPILRPSVDKLLKLPIYQQSNTNEQINGSVLHQCNYSICRPIALCLSGNAVINRKKKIFI